MLYRFLASIVYVVAPVAFSLPYQFVLHSMRRGLMLGVLTTFL